MTVKTYEDTTTINSARQGEVVTVTTYQDTTTTKKVYKVTKYQKKSPEKKVEFTIDAKQNLISINALPGLKLSADAGIGGVINNLSEKGYISLSVNARGQLTAETSMSLGLGEKLRNGELSTSLSAKVKHEITENLAVFAGVSSSTLDAWSELLSMERAIVKAGVEYEFDKWTLEKSVMIGEDLEGISILMKRNQNYFIEGLKTAVAEISDSEADNYIRSVYGEGVNVENYRADAKLFLGGLKYSQALQGSLTKFGVSFMSVGVDRILSLVLGFATGAEIAKKVYPHEGRAHENFRNFLSKSGESLSQIRHIRKIEMEELKV